MTPSRSQSFGSDFSPEEDDPSWTSGGRFRHGVASETNPWEACFKSVHRYDKEMSERWRDEIDKLLIFAGLFSAAVTAFTVEAYKMLQPDPTDLLATIIVSANGTSAHPPTFHPDSFAIRVNIFWFLSLVLSLSTVVVGVLSMQWLREYQREDSHTAAEHALGLRQMRYHGLFTWRVPEIINALPLLLQSAVLLFFCGILDLLWSLHHLVALIVTIPVAILVIFLLATTILPALQYTFTRKLNLRIPQCPYKSPQSWIFHRIISSISVLIFKITESLNFKSLFRFETRERHSLIRGLFAASDWRAYDKRWRLQRDSQLSKPQLGGLIGRAIVREDVAHGLAWIVNSFSRDLKSVIALYKCFQSMNDAEKEVMLLTCERITPLSLDFQNKLGGEGVPAVSDYLCLRALDHLLAAIGYGSDATSNLLQHRVELYIRIVRASIHLQQRPMLYCPFKYFAKFSEEVQIQLLKIANLFLSQSDRESDHATAIMILHQTSIHPAIRLPTFAQSHKESGSHLNISDIWEELRQGYSDALTDAIKSFIQRPRIFEYQSVRVQVYKWFLRVIMISSSTTPSSTSILETTLPIFKIIAPIIQSSLPSTTNTNSEYPTNPIFKLSWTALLKKRYDELFHIAIQQINTDDRTLESLFETYSVNSGTRSATD